MLDNAVKALMVDDSHTVEQLMVPICQSIGISTHIEYSLVWDNRPKVITTKDEFIMFRMLVLKIQVNYEIDFVINLMSNCRMRLKKKELYPNSN